MRWQSTQASLPTKPGVGPTGGPVVDHPRVPLLDNHLPTLLRQELYYPDGGHRELSTQYHKTGIRDLLFLEQFQSASGAGYFLQHEPYRTRLREVLRWLTHILMPDGSTAVLNSAAAATDWLVFCLVANRQLQDPELAWHVSRWFSREYVPRQKPIPALCARILGTGDAPEACLPPTAKVSPSCSAGSSSSEIACPRESR